MTSNQCRVRFCRSTGEVEIEGSPEFVSEWWERVSPEIGPAGLSEAGLRSEGSGTKVVYASVSAVGAGSANGGIPENFGEYLQQFPDGVSDLDKVLIAAAFSQSRTVDQTFTTKAANELLMDQKIRVANASQSVRRLIESKRAFAVSGGRFCVSKTGLDYLEKSRTA